ncbi:hypothetical protein [Ruegeria sp. Ofav3-42]|uniref:hypothetical protein n=1 Tax=Ruegeria sp. Ofav3-42 TaxID=2917759 RepID=UPI001EF53E6C|nr:hypothetical protein [Ruegeria sp. Ofav3-42]MCG7520838.1 hypothetical protein [Ruegeria sp. Ofav3-42]
MAREQDLVEVEFGELKELTNADVSQLTFMVLSGKIEILRATSVQPIAEGRGWAYEEGFGERNISLDDISSAAGNRVWAYGKGHPTSKVMVDHA